MVEFNNFSVALLANVIAPLIVDVAGTVNETAFVPFPSKIVEPVPVTFQLDPVKVTAVPLLIWKVCPADVKSVG